MGGSTRIPRLQKALNELLDIEPSKAIEPDTAIACGCAIQASLLRGKVCCSCCHYIYSQLIQDNIERSPTTEVMIAPHSIGIESVDGKMHVLLAKGAVLPASASVKCTAASAELPQIFIQLFEGESDNVKDNRLIAKCVAHTLAAVITIELSEQGALKLTAHNESKSETYAAMTLEPHA